MLDISKDEFLEVYKDTEVLQYVDIFYSDPVSDKDYIENYLTSKLWRLNNLYTIINKKGKKVKFRMRLAQHKVYAASLRHCKLIILKSRQQGISTLWLVAFFDDCIFNPHFNSGLMAQGQDEAELLLSRIQTLWDNFSEELKKFLDISIETNNTKQVGFSNKSIIFIRTSFRSATLQRLHISEFGKIANRNPERAQETKSGTLEAIAPGNTTVIESTAEGENMFKDMWDNAWAFAGNKTEEDFEPVFLSWIDDPDCNIDIYQKPTPKEEQYFDKLESRIKKKLTITQKNFWISKSRKLKKYIYQEYPATPEEAFLKNREGTYYAEQYLSFIREPNREIENLFDPNLPVQVAVDLGMNDISVYLFFQTYSDGFRIIDCYTNSGQGIEHYCKVMDKMSSQFGYNIEKLILPHDARVRSITSGITREQAFYNFGYSNTYVLSKTKSLNNDIEIVRQNMRRIFIDPKAQYIIDCFLNYTKEYDKLRDIWKNIPEHNIYSHGADAIRYMVVGADLYDLPYEDFENSYEGMDV